MHQHHVIYEQTVRRERGNVRAPENLMPLCLTCHARHHDGTPWRLPVSSLPTSVFDFAAELMGTGPAYEYIARRYDGTDERLEELRKEADGA